MKAIFEKLNTDSAASFLFRSFTLPAFDAPFHFHPELELTLIHRGEGQRYVGTQVEGFMAGDLALLGANLPHCWISKPTEAGEWVAATVIQFRSDFLGTYVLDLPEFRKIKNLMNRAKTGLKITGETQRQVRAKIEQMPNQTHYQRLLMLLDLLGDIAYTTDLTEMDVSFSQISYSQNETIRFQRVFAYLIEHYREDIPLHKIAEVAHLSPTSFCRYFKAITGKTFVEFVNEYRIQYACQLLQKSHCSVSDVAFESGFGDVPYFNKLFKKHKGLTPLAFRQG